MNTPSFLTKTVAVAGLAVLLTSTPGCAGRSAANHRVVHKQWRLAMSFPRDWRVSTGLPHLPVSARHRKLPAVSFNVFIQPLPSQAQEQFKKHGIKAPDILNNELLKNNMPPGSSQSAYTLDGQPGQQVEMILSQIIDGRAVYAATIQIIALRGLNVYSLTAVSLDQSEQAARDKLEAIRPQIRQIVSSFRFTDRPFWQRLWGQILIAVLALTAAALIIVFLKRRRT
jgi:hypothetical protein